MARKKKHEEHVNHERWLVSYADFITLLFATFTALFAMSNADKEKLAKAAASIKAAFANPGASLFSNPALKNSAGGGGNIVISITPSTPAAAPARPAPRTKAAPDKKDDGKDDMDNIFEGITPFKNKTDGEEAEQGAATPTPTPTPTPPVTPTPSPRIAMGTEGSGNEALAAEIKELMANMGLEKVVAVREEKRGTVISLGEAAFFAPGSIEVLPNCINQLDKIVNALRNKSYEIRVEGHTDNTPVTSGRYRDNWELSSLRASRIVEFMEKEYKFDPKSLSAAGYGESRPIADNITKDGQQKNRRVDIVILNEQSKAQEPR